MGNTFQSKHFLVDERSNVDDATDDHLNNLENGDRHLEHSWHCNFHSSQEIVTVHHRMNKGIHFNVINRVWWHWGDSEGVVTQNDNGDMMVVVKEVLNFNR